MTFNVLSLFDGISCGRQALKNIGARIDNYFASEIDAKAIAVSKRNHPDIIPLGDVRGVKAENLPKIDLLIGGSPCQGFSLAGKLREFNDPRSSLYFEFVRILRESRPKYFLLENVQMRKAAEEFISKDTGVEPIKICSSVLVPQTRKRLYWTNIAVDHIFPKETSIKNILIDRSMCEDITTRFFSKKEGTLAFTNSRKFVRRCHEKMRCLTARGQTVSNTGATNFLIGDRYYKPHPIECERSQGLPDDYTKGFSKTTRYKMLGNCWTVPVIEHIFKGTPEFWDILDF